MRALAQRDRALGARRSAQCSWRSPCTRSSTAASSRTRSPGWRSRSPPRRSPRRPGSGARVRAGAAAGARRHGVSGRLERARPRACSASSAASCMVVVPELGSQPWPFAPDARRAARACSGPLVRAADREWDLGVPRSAALLAACSWPRRPLAAWRSGRLAAAGSRSRSRRSSSRCSSCRRRCLQVGLRDATEPWQFTNDSTYQIELAGDLDPRRREPVRPRLRRHRPRALLPGGRLRAATADAQVALSHFAYFPGTPLTAAAWRAAAARRSTTTASSCCSRRSAPPASCCSLPGAARLAARRRRGRRRKPARRARRVVRDGRHAEPRCSSCSRSRSSCAVALPCAAGRARRRGAAQAVRARRDAVPRRCCSCTRGAARRRSGAAGVLRRRARRRLRCRSSSPTPGALWDDTIAYGTGTYRIIGYGLAGLLRRAPASSTTLRRLPVRAARARSSGCR